MQAHLLKSHTKFNGEWQDLTAAEASPKTATLGLGYQHDAFSLELQLQTLRDYQDEAGQRLEGYHLAHLNGYYQLTQGKVSFGIQKLLDKQYQTQWSQRAQIIYGTLSTPTLFDYPGQGRRFSLSYELAF